MAWKVCTSCGHLYTRRGCKNLTGCNQNMVPAYYDYCDWLLKSSLLNWRKVKLESPVEQQKFDQKLTKTLRKLSEERRNSASALTATGFPVISTPEPVAPTTAADLRKLEDRPPVTVKSAGDVAKVKIAIDQLDANLKGLIDYPAIEIPAIFAENMCSHGAISLLLNDDGKTPMLSLGAIKKEEDDSEAETVHNELKRVKKAGDPDIELGWAFVFDYLLPRFSSALPQIEWDIPIDVEFRKFAVDFFLPNFFGTIGSLVPGWKELQGVKEVMVEGKKTYTMHSKRKGLQKAKSRLKPQTPIEACSLVVDRLAYYRNYHGANAAVSAVALLAGVLDHGLGSGPAKALARTGLRLHALSVAWRELVDFREAEKPWDKFLASPTIAAWVLARYPAAAVLDLNNVTPDEFLARQGWLLQKGSVMKECVERIRKAGQSVLKESPLTVVEVPKLDTRLGACIRIFEPLPSPQVGSTSS